MITKERLNRQAVLVLLVLAGVLAYTTFQWGGVVRTGRYQYLLVLGLLAMLLSLGRSPERVVAASWPFAAMGSSTPASVCAVAGSPIASGSAARAIASAGRGDGRAGAGRSKGELRFVERFSRWHLPVLLARLRVHGDLSSDVRS